jgi:CheY-like chemotaxis protein
MAGYQVHASAEPEQALATLREHGRSIDVLLTDVMLPGMGSRQLAAQSLALSPDLLLIYMSGYTEDAILHRGGLHPNAAFIDKPISAEALLGRLRQVLAGRA